MRDPNEGARLLRLAKEVDALTDDDIETRIAARVAELAPEYPAALRGKGGSPNRYMSGERLPDLLRALALEKEFEIPPAAWFQRATSTRGIKPRARQNGQATQTEVNR